MEKKENKGTALSAKVWELKNAGKTVKVEPLRLLPDCLFDTNPFHQHHPWTFGQHSLRYFSL